MVDAQRTQGTFQEHRRRGSALPRWELLLPLRLSEVAETNKLVFTFASELGGVERLFPATFGAPYIANGKGGHSAEGRWLYFVGDAVHVGMSTQHGEPAPWDGGVQDAVLKTMATELLAYVVRAEKERWTDSPFEEHDPPPLGRDAARELLLRITSERVFVAFDVDYFSPAEAANPDLEVHFHDADERCIRVCASTVPARSGGSWVAPGPQKVTAIARVFSQGLGRWTQKGNRARDVLWRSPTVAVDLRLGHRYRFEVGVPRALRALNEQERRFLLDASASLDPPREILQLRLVEQLPSAGAGA